MRTTPLPSGIACALLLCLMLTTPPCARAQDGDAPPEAPADPADPATPEDNEAAVVHAVLSYGPATVHDLYGEHWDAESLRLSYTYFTRYYGLSAGMEFLSADTDTRRLEGSYFRHGVEALVYLTPGVHRVQPYAGVGLGAHYNFIDLSGEEDSWRDGVGVRLIGEAGLRVSTLGLTVFGRPARLLLGVHARYSASREYFFGDSARSDTADFHTTEFGIQLGMSFEP